MSWEELIEYLSRDIDWHDPSAGQFQLLETALCEIARSPQEIVKRVNAIIVDDTLFRSYQPHMECPRQFMDKFILYMDSSDRFRVRLHRFKSRLQNRGLKPTVHTHRWWYSTIVLRGSYTEHLYNVEGENPELGKAKISIANTRELKRGQTASLLPNIPHQTVNDSVEEPCITLFVRGKSFYPASKVYDPETGDFKLLHGLQSQLRQELKSLADTLTAA
jgi:predicted metal-dependent enzyme (double-stranded beta helix superfamily)